MSETRRKSYHLSVSIAGMLKRGVHAFTFFDDDQGKPVPKKVARDEFRRLAALGHKKYPSGGCDNFDPFEHGCLGHDSTEAKPDGEEKV